MGRERLDQALVSKGLTPSRNVAQSLIKGSYVKVNHTIINKPHFIVEENDLIEIIEDQKFVSRAGYKLEAAIKNFHIDLKDKIVLDIGASTGGFTDCCLQYGAKLVYALDVGTDQLHSSLKNHSQVVNWEQTHLDEIPRLKFDPQIDIIVCDVSFISLKRVFQSIKHIANPQMMMIFLIKPQFELDKKTVDKFNAKIDSSAVHKIVIEKVKCYAFENGFKCLGVIDSPIVGAKKQNHEFLGWFQYSNLNH